MDRGIHVGCVETRNESLTHRNRVAILSGAATRDRVCQRAAGASLDTPYVTFSPARTPKTSFVNFGSAAPAVAMILGTSAGSKASGFPLMTP